MAILYALVARGSVVLAEYSATATNASTISRQILEKIPGNNDSHVSYSQDRYIFHVKRTDGLTVLCMADDSAGSKPFFLIVCLNCEINCSAAPEFYFFFVIFNFVRYLLLGFHCFKISIILLRSLGFIKGLF